MSTTPDAEAILRLTVAVTVDRDSDPAARRVLEAAYRWATIEPSPAALGDMDPVDFERAMRAFGNLGWKHGDGPQEVPASRLPLVVEALGVLRRSIEEYLAQPGVAEPLAVEWRSGLDDLDNAARLVGRMVAAVRTASVPERVYASVSG